MKPKRSSKAGLSWHAASKRPASPARLTALPPQNHCALAAIDRRPTASRVSQKSSQSYFARTASNSS
jgi:hypothetical protein